MSERLYKLCWWLLTPLVPLYLRHRVRRRKEEEAYLNERYGAARHQLSASESRVVWIHAASVGEVNSILSLSEYLRRHAMGRYSFLLTTSSRNGQKAARNSVDNFVAVQYLPLDHPRWAARFIAHYRPYAALWVEQELWPNILLEAQRQGVRLALINGRLTESSERRWRHFGRGFINRIAQAFALTLAQSPQDAANFRALGFTARYVGNLKALPPPQGLKKLPKMSALLPKNRSLWLAASLHSGEDSLCFAAHCLLREHLTPPPFLILVPRYPEQAHSMQNNAQKYGLNALLYSEWQAAIDPQTDILIINSFGLLSALYGIVPLGYLGGSAGTPTLTRNHGGHNPLEAIAQGCCTICGQDMRNFSSIAETLTTANALITIETTPENLERELRALMTDKKRREKIAQNGYGALKTLTAEAQATATLIAKWLDNEDPHSHA